MKLYFVEFEFFGIKDFDMIIFFGNVVGLSYKQLICFFYF